MNRVSRLNRVEDAIRRRNVPSVIVVYADTPDEVEQKIAEARTARGLHPDDDSVQVIVVSYVDTQL